MKTKTVNIINFYELDPEWQAEAISNLDEFAIEALYFEPEEAHNPTEHILWDLSEVMPHAGVHESGFQYNCVMGISNNTAMLIYLDDSGEEAQYIIV